MIQKRLSAEKYINGVLDNDKVILGRTITLIESNQPKDQELAFEIIEELMPKTGNSIRIGITGIPGAGKSTFIESFGTYLTKNLGKRIAVLAIDPSSILSKGSIMGDKTRMENLSSSDLAFIRPSPTGTTLGGVTAKTREVLLLCEAAGYEIILVETVGVGQSETAVRNMVDFFVLLMLFGTGDDLQGIKRGILEMADLIAINKADGSNLEKAKEAQKQLEMALHMFPKPDSGQNLKVMTCSSLEGIGIDKIWSEIADHIEKTKKSGFFGLQRKDQNIKWMHDYVSHSLTSKFYSHNRVQSKLKDLEELIANGKLSPQQAGKMLMDIAEV